MWHLNASSVGVLGGGSGAVKFLVNTLKCIRAVKCSIKAPFGSDKDVFVAVAPEESKSFIHTEAFKSDFCKHARRSRKTNKQTNSLIILQYYNNQSPYKGTGIP